MLKKISCFLAVAFAALFLSACGYKLSAPVDGAAEKNREEESTIARTFVGSYTKEVGIMGTIYGGHLINLYTDGKAQIRYAFYGGLMGGSSSGLYEGTYTLENEVLDIDYSAEGKEHSFHAEIADGSLRGQIVLGMSDTPDDKTDGSNPGLTYFEIPKTAVTNSGRAFWGAARGESGYSAQVLELNHSAEDGSEGEFSLTIASSDCTGEISGAFVKNGKTLTFTYDVPAVADGEILSVVLTEDYSSDISMLNEYVLISDFNIGNIPAGVRPTLVMGKN